MSVSDAVTTSAGSTSAGDGPDLYRFSVEQFHQMQESGLFPDDMRLELVEGCLAMMTPINPRHRLAVQETQKRLLPLVPQGWELFVQQPATFAASELQPDLYIARGSNRDYADCHPGSGDLALVIEVAESTLRLDRATKLAVYATAGVPVNWIINLVDRQVEAYRDPRPTVLSGAAEYATRLTYDEHSRVPLVIAHRVLGEIPVDDILP